MQGLFGTDAVFVNIYSMAGMIWVDGLHYSPMAFLLMTAAFRSMDPSLEESALMSGATVPQIAAVSTRFVHVVDLTRDTAKYDPAPLSSHATHLADLVVRRRPPDPDEDEARIHATGAGPDGDERLAMVVLPRQKCAYLEFSN